MIKSFAHKGLERFFHTGSTAGIQVKHAKRLNLILTHLDQAETAQDMAVPGFRLHPLKGNMKGLWSVAVSGNWRVTFCMEDGNAHIINYLDYH